MTRGGALTAIHNFSGEYDGAGGYGAPTFASDGYFYGLAAGSGSNQTGNGGQFFRFSPSGSFQVLHTLNSLTEGNALGGPLVQAMDGKFYGVAESGGSGCPNQGSGDADMCGTIFRLSSDGGMEVLHSFAGGADGAHPDSLTAGSDGNLYGCTSGGGDVSVDGGDGGGTLFKVDLQGNFSVVHTFEPNDAAPSCYFAPYVAEPNGALYDDPNYIEAASGSGNFGILYTDGRVSALSVQFSGPSIQGFWSSPFLAGPDGNLSA